MSPSALPRPTEVRQAYQQDMDPAHKSMFWSWVSFTATFATVRVITYTIKAGVGPLHNLSTRGGTHLHHYLWGITAVSAVGGLAVRGEQRAVEHPGAAVAYGAGLALIVDEFSLLLDLKDVYWAREGRWSVDLAVGLIAVTGSALAAAPIGRRLRRNRQD